MSSKTNPGAYKNFTRSSPLGMIIQTGRVCVICCNISFITTRYCIQIESLLEKLYLFACTCGFREPILHNTYSCNSTFSTLIIQKRIRLSFREKKKHVFFRKWVFPWKQNDVSLFLKAAKFYVAMVLYAEIHQISFFFLEYLCGFGFFLFVYFFVLPTLNVVTFVWEFSSQKFTRKLWKLFARGRTRMNLERTDALHGRNFAQTHLPVIKVCLWIPDAPEKEDYPGL